jgi:hypothetical protein
MTEYVTKKALLALLGIVLLSMFHPVSAQSYSVGYSQPYYVPYSVRVDFTPSTPTRSASWVAVDYMNAKKSIAEIGLNQFTFRTEDANSFVIRFSAQYRENVTIYGVTTELASNASMKPVIHDWAWMIHGNNFTFVFAVTTSLPPTLSMPGQYWTGLIALVEAAVIVFETIIGWQLRNRLQGEKG